MSANSGPDVEESLFRANTGSLVSPTESLIRHQATIPSQGPSGLNFKRWLVPVAAVAGILILIVAGLTWFDNGTEALVRECRLARIHRDWLGEKNSSELWLKRDPGNGDALLYLAEARSELGDIPGAIECLGSVPRNHPRAVAALVEKANLEWVDLNQPLSGLQTCEEVLNLNPSTIEANARIIAFYAFTLQRPQMLDAIQRAIKNRGEPKEAYVYLILADELIMTNALDLNAQWLASNPDNDVFRVAGAVQMVMQLGANVNATGKQELQDQQKRAVARIEELLASFPGHPVILTVLMDYYIASGDVARVGELLAAASDAAASHHLIWAYRGWYHLNVNENDEAEKSFENALHLDPVSWRTRNEYATLLRRQGRTAEAEKMQQMATFCRKELRDPLLKLPTARDVTPELLAKIADYVRDCGEDSIARAIEARVLEMTNSVPGTLDGRQSH